MKTISDKNEMQEISSKTLFAGQFICICGACGKAAVAQEYSHETVAAHSYEGRTENKGCSTRWEYITPQDSLSKKDVEEARPDLIVIEQNDKGELLIHE